MKAADDTYARGNSMHNPVTEDRALQAQGAAHSPVRNAAEGDDHTHLPGID